MRIPVQVPSFKLGCCLRLSWAGVLNFRDRKRPSVGLTNSIRLLTTLMWRNEVLGVSERCGEQERTLLRGLLFVAHYGANFFPTFIHHVWLRVLWTFTLNFLSPFGCKGSFVGDFGLSAFTRTGGLMLFSLYIV